jgi:hypothetical protein
LGLWRWLYSIDLNMTSLKAMMNAEKSMVQRLANPILAI